MQDIAEIIVKKARVTPVDTGVALWLDMLSRAPLVNVRLGFYHGSPSEVEFNPLGFATATEAVHICFEAEAASGILCAVINDASDPRNILPLGKCSP